MTNEQEALTEGAQLPVAPATVRDALIAELEALGPFVQNLSTDDWSKPSAAAGWTIGNVVAHLDLALGLYSGVLDAAFRGWGSGSAWKRVGQLTEKIAPSAAGAFNAINSALPRAMSGALSPEIVKGQFAAGSRTLRTRLDRLGPGDYTRRVHYLGRPLPLSFFLGAVLNELAIHGWDMRSRLEPDAHLSAGARAVLPWFYHGATGLMFHPPEGMSGTVEANLQDPPAPMWWVIAPTGVRAHAGEVAADATIAGETGTFVLLLAGRLTVEDALRTTSLTVSGDEVLAKRFLGAWRIT